MNIIRAVIALRHKLCAREAIPARQMPSDGRTPEYFTRFITPVFIQDVNRATYDLDIRQILSTISSAEELSLQIDAKFIDNFRKLCPHRSIERDYSIMFKVPIAALTHKHLIAKKRKSTLCEALAEVEEAMNEYNEEIDRTNTVEELRINAEDRLFIIQQFSDRYLNDLRAQTDED